MKNARYQHDEYTKSGPGDSTAPVPPDAAAHAVDAALDALLAEQDDSAPARDLHGRTETERTIEGITFMIAAALVTVAGLLFLPLSIAFVPLLIAAALIVRGFVML